MKKNNSAGKPYYTQRNNNIKPASACMTTSMINALSSAGWPVENLSANGSQPEDELLRFIMTDAACERKWKQLDPAGRYPPNEWHEVLALGTNLLLAKHALGKDAVQFHPSITEAAVKSVIDSGGALVVSGRFKTALGRLSHAVSVVGYEDSGGGTVFILDDPWGDYHSGYTDVNGNDVKMDEADWKAYIKDCGKEAKRANLVRKYTA